MLRLVPGDVHASLQNCYHVLKEHQASMQLSDAGRSGGRGDKQADMALAAKVVAVIDRGMDALGAAYYNFVYCQTDDFYPAYSTLAVYVRERAVARFADTAQDFKFTSTVISLALLVPYECKHRVFSCRGRIKSNKGVLHTNERLADLCGVSRATFCSRYRVHWDAMMRDFFEIAVDREQIILDRLDLMENIYS